MDLAAFTSRRMLTLRNGTLLLQGLSLASLNRSSWPLTTRTISPETRILLILNSVHLRGLVAWAQNLSERINFCLIDDKELAKRTNFATIAVAYVDKVY